jgi:hypothetical protein
MAVKKYTKTTKTKKPGTSLSSINQKLQGPTSNLQSSTSSKYQVSKPTRGLTGTSPTLQRTSSNLGVNRGGKTLPASASAKAHAAVSKPRPKPRPKQASSFSKPITKRVTKERNARYAK